MCRAMDGEVSEEEFGEDDGSDPGTVEGGSTAERSEDAVTDEAETNASDEVGLGTVDLMGMSA